LLIIILIIILNTFQLTLNPNLFAKKPKPAQDLTLAPTEPVAPTTASIKEEPESEQMLTEEAGCEGSGAGGGNTPSFPQETATDAEQSLMKMQLRK